MITSTPTSIIQNFIMTQKLPQDVYRFVTRYNQGIMVRVVNELTERRVDGQEGWRTRVWL